MINIIKRNGQKQAFLPNKIHTRIKAQAKGLKVDIDKIFQKVIPGITDEMTTTQLDEFIAFSVADFIRFHPDYSILASRILITRQGKLIGVEPQEVDLNYDFVGTTTFFRGYSKKDDNRAPVELPSMMYDRVADFFGIDEAEANEFREELKAKRISVATPILSNAGTGRTSYISCNITTNISDDIAGIEQTLTNAAYGSKEGSGIGLLLDNVRSSDSMVSSFKGNASGIVRYADMLQSKMRFYKQGERAGSAAVYVSLWHRDIIPFLELKLPTGDEKLRARDLFLAVVINDNFMRALRDEKDWYLFCPNELLKAGIKPLQDLWGDEYEAEYNRAVELGLGKVISPKTIWDAIIKSQAETGVPYTFFKDTANRGNMQDNIGTISSSNLCVAPNTKILTKEGYKEIYSLEGEQIDVWNGEEWSQTEVFKTGENKDLVRVVTNSGYELDCTPYHKFYIQENYSSKSIKEVRACDLKEGDKLIKFDLPVIEGYEELKYAYTQGVFSGDGCMDYANPSTRRIFLPLYGEKQDLIPHLDIRNKYTQHGANAILTSEKAIKINSALDKTMCYLPEDMIADKAFVPGVEYSIKSRLLWLAGLADSDGTVTNNQGSQSIQIASINKKFLQDVQLMLQTLGCDSKVTLARVEGIYDLPANDGTGMNKKFNCKSVNRLLINGNSLYKLMALGLTTHRLKCEVKKPQRECSQFIKIKSVEDLPDLYDTYCFTEQKRNMGMFNGILTGQCIEFLGVSKPNYTSQCDLGLVNLAEHDTLESIAKSTGVLTRILNRVIDKNTWSDEASKNAGEDQRSIGIGIGGLADFFAKKELAFTSNEAKEWNKKISETIYKSSVKESSRMAVKEDRNYPAYKGSKYERGITYVEGWSPLAQGGPIPMLNSILNCYMPSAGTSLLLGVNECFEPFSSNLQVRSVGAGEFVILNKLLVKDLEKINMWNESVMNNIIINGGSVQYLDIPEDIKERYKTVWEIPQKEIINMAADRQKFIDQSQSMNLHFEDISYAKINSSLRYGWELGLKTGSYYMRSKSKLAAPSRLAGISNEAQMPKKPDNSQFECFGCSS